LADGLTRICGVGDTQTNVFKAAVSGAGMANLISEFGTEDHPAGDEWFYGVPWEQPEGFMNSSPFVHLKKRDADAGASGDADTVDRAGAEPGALSGVEAVWSGDRIGGLSAGAAWVSGGASIWWIRLNRILGWYGRSI